MKNRYDYSRTDCWTISFPEEEDYSIGKFWWFVFICSIFFIGFVIIGGIYLLTLAV